MRSNTATPNVFFREVEKRANEESQDEEIKKESHSNE
jgi:hypothetical protein